MNDGLSPSLEDIVDTCQELAKRWFESPNVPTYTKIIQWDDGDFRVEVIHGMGKAEDFSYHESEQIVYKDSWGSFSYQIIHEYDNRSFDIVTEEKLPEVP